MKATKEGRAVVLLSGGIDSSTCFMQALQDHEEVQPVFVEYGQQTQELEKKQARSLISFAAGAAGGVTDIEQLKVVDYTDVFGHFAEGVAEEGKNFDHLNENDGRSSGYVPMRNLHLIATAAAIADVQDAGYVYHGAQMGDAEDYPDCRPEFMAAAEKAISNALPEQQELHLKTPLIDLTKEEVIQKGEDLRVPWELTYSCYKDTDVDNPEPCGECPACLERAEAFESAGVPDPYMP